MLMLPYHDRVIPLCSDAICSESVITICTDLSLPFPFFVLMRYALNR